MAVKKNRSKRAQSWKKLHAEARALAGIDYHKWACDPEVKQDLWIRLAKRIRRQKQEIRKLKEKINVLSAELRDNESWGARVPK